MANGGYGRRLVLDNSAWARIVAGQLPEELRLRWEASVYADEILVCDPFRLEALYSAMSATDYAQISEELDGFLRAPSDRSTWNLALAGQAALAAHREVSHRVKAVDLLVAAAATQASAGVLHFDHDFDTIASHAGLAFESVWIAPRGSLP